MDQPCSFEDLRACLCSLSQLNRVTRGYRPTLHWLDRLYSTLPRRTTPVHIVDVGCGFGDTLRRVHRWAASRGLPVRLTGIDLNSNAVRAAREVTRPGTVMYLSGNAFDFAPPEGIDVVISSLMTHHMEDHEIVEFLRWMESSARLGWFINDLHRQPVPYHLYPLLCHILGSHPFVKHDGRVSFLRSFRREDWIKLCKAAAVPEESFTISEFTPARLCVGRLR